MFKSKKNIIYVFLFSFFIFGCGQVGSKKVTQPYTGNYIQEGNKFYSLQKEGTAIWAGSDQGVLKFDSGQCIQYSSQDGLVNNIVYSIAIDSSRNKWFGTNSGISRFDGKIWKNYTTGDGILGTHVFALVIDKNNNIWCGTELGLSKFDGNVWTSYNLEKGLPYPQVYCLLVDKNNNIWVGTGGRLGKFDGNKWKVYSIYNSKITSNIILSLKEDSLGNILVGTISGINKFNGENWVPYTTQNLKNSYIYALELDKTGNIWIGTHEGISCLNGNKWDNFDIKSGLPSNKINSIVIDENDLLWVATNGGLVSLKIEDNEIKNYNIFNAKNPAQKVNNINNVQKDNSGNYWFATDKGLLKKSGINWELISEANNISIGKINSMLLDSQSNLWCGTENGLFGFNGTSWTHYDTTNGLAHNYINALTWDSTSQDLWIGTIQGLNVLDKNLTLIKPQISELPSNFISAIQYFDTGTILIGTPLGLSKFEKNSIKTYTTSDKLLDNYIQTIHVDKEKRILAGTRMSVSIFDSSVWTNPFVKINNKNILSINTQIETTWIGTWSGVSLYFNTTFETTYYPDKKINYIYKDTDQSMWFASSDGTINFKDNQWINYTFIEEFGDGKINSIEKNKNGIWVTQKDKIAEYKNPNWKFYNLQNTEINNMTFDSLNLPIVATTSGVFKLNNSNDWQQLDTTKGLKVNKLKYIDKNLWIAHDKGVSFIDSTGLFFDTSIIPAYLIAYNNKYQEIWCGSANGVNILNSIGTWTNYDSNKNVIGSKINDIIFDTSFNTTWIATDKGISEFYNSSGIWAWLNNYVLGNASPVYSIEFTSDGHLWACTPIGLGEYYNNAWTIYDTTFNLPTNKINDIYTNSSGEKWISTDKGVTKWSGAEKKLFLPIK